MGGLEPPIQRRAKRDHQEAMHMSLWMAGSSPAMEK
jgi:hypothetical protein